MISVIACWRRAAAVALAIALSATTAVAADLPGALATDDVALQRMERAASDYRDMATRAAWPEFPDGPTLHPGKADPRIPALRRILSIAGDLPSDPSEPSNVYGSDLADAVRTFQRRHGLNPDAVIGRNTRAALAVSTADRARALALNLERLRELRRRLPAEVIVVDIPAFALTVLSDGRPEWQTRVIVGKPSWRTPTFDSQITRIELNPYWNVPPSIARRELAPLIAADPDYLARHDMNLLPGNRLRQDPGPDNPLGQVKFQIPNPYDVYLHDTPSKRSFALDMRALSHGCIRVENAMELAARLLAAEPGWDAGRLAAEVATGWNARIPLTRPVPVAIIYVTAWVDPAGAVQFRPDLYGRDMQEVAANPESCGAGGLG